MLTRYLMTALMVVTGFAQFRCSDGGDDLDATAACTAGVSRSCSCPEGGSGVQFCAADGSGFSACACACTAACDGLQCGLDPVCGMSCGMCPSGQTCTADGQCSVARLFIEGRTRPNAVVDVSLNGVSVAREMATAGGDFIVGVPSDDSDAAVVLTALGTGREAQSEFVSVLDTVARLEVRAGPDLRLDVNEHGGVVLNGLSTVRAAVLAGSRPGGALPRTRAEVEAAERSINQTLLATTMLDAAIALDLAAERSVALPAGFATTWALAQDLRSLRDFTRAIQPEPNDPEGPLANAIAALFETPDGFVPFEPDGEYVAGLRLQRDDRVGRDRGRFLFGADGQARFQVARRPYLPEQAYTWDVREGQVELFATRPDEVIETLPVGAVLELIDDPALEGPIRAALANQELAVAVRRDRERVKRVGEGINVEWVLRWSEDRYAFDEALEPFGIGAPEVSIRRLATSEIWVRADSLVPLPLSPEDVTGAWLMRLRLPATRDDVFGGHGAGDPVLASALVTLNADGTGAASDGLITGARPLNWFVDARERLNLVFSDGEQQSMVLLARTTEEYGFMTTHGSGQGQRTDYGRDIMLPTVPTVDPAAIQNPPGTYWQTTINFADAETATDGSTTRLPDVFGFVFGPLGATTRVQYDFFEQRVEQFDFFEQYSIDADRVFVDTFYSSDGSVGLCELNDGSCLPYRRRTWRLIDQTAETLTVLESRQFLRRWRELQQGDYTFDATRQQWRFGDGTVLDTNDYIDFVLPRINVYLLRPLP